MRDLSRFPLFSPQLLKKHEQLGEGGTQLFVAIYYLLLLENARPCSKLNLRLLLGECLNRDLLKITAFLKDLNLPKIFLHLARLIVENIIPEYIKAKASNKVILTIFSRLHLSWSWKGHHKCHL